MDAETLSLLLLTQIPGVGPRTLQTLRSHFGSAERVRAASGSELQSVEGIGAQLARAILCADPRDAEQEGCRCQELGIRLIADTSSEYPPLLREIVDPPAILYARGQASGLDALTVALVGTRHASAYGLRQADRFAASLSRVGVTVVSGLARGIDAAAHCAALAAGGSTWAVLAGGLAEIYPPEHRRLADEIAEQGLVISEMGLNTRPRRGAFPRRNRLISGVSLGTLVVEARLRSGALITARHALEQGRDVFAIPGPIDQPGSQGCHQLLRDGAKLVEFVDDILEELGPLAAPLRSPEGRSVRDGRELCLNTQEQQVLQAIDDTEVAVDHVVSRSGLPVQRVLATLTVLETRHLIRRVGGDRVARWTNECDRA